METSYPNSFRVGMFGAPSVVGAGHPEDAHFFRLHLGQGLAGIGVEHVDIAPQKGDHGLDRRS